MYRYSQLLSFTSPTELAKLGEEFVQYQLLDKEGIPQEVWEEACVVHSERDEDCHYRMDIIWHFLSTAKGGDGCLTFPTLSNIARFSAGHPILKCR